MSFYDLALQVAHVTFTVLCWSHKPAMIQCRKETQKGPEHREMKITKLSQRLTIP